MKISAHKTTNTSFRGSKTTQIFPENPKNPNFVSNITLNSAAETLTTNKRLSILPSGSWMTGNNYDPKLSDHDMTILAPNNTSYSKMEADIFDAKECLKETVLKKLKAHNIPEDAIYKKILPSINIFPTPQMKECFESYQQFRDLTNLKISLHDKVDLDKGLWQMKGLLVNHFENEGNLLYLKEDGSLAFARISQNKQGFHDYLKQKNIYMSQDSTFFSTDKLKIINEFIDVMDSGKEVTTRSFFKYLQRVQKFFFRDSENDLFLIGGDERKSNLPKFQNRIKIEKEYQDQFVKISKNFNEIKISTQAELPEEFAKQTLKDLKLFKELSMEILKWPSLRGFKVR